MVSVHPPRQLQCGRFRFNLDERPLVMGILNVTPDSFSDGGRHLNLADAVSAAQKMKEDGADLIDIGAESTRPGSSPVPPDVEWTRIEPVLRELQSLGCALSVDTRHADVMRRAVDIGVDMLNDVAAFTDPGAVDCLRGNSVGACVMHMKGDPQTMQQAPHYDDVVREVSDYLTQRVAVLEQAGVEADRICVDPGFGFGKSLEHNLQLLTNLTDVASRHRAMLVGLSRKSVIGALTRRPPSERIGGSVGAALAAIERGADIVRVHDVSAHVDALRIWTAVNEQQHRERQHRSQSKRIQTTKE